MKIFMKIRKTCCMVIALVILLSFYIADASAIVSPLIRGDIDCDSMVTIKDATLIQKYQADIIELSKRDIFTGDVDGDDEATIKDVTLIQKKVAGIIDKFVTEDVLYNTIEIDNLYADYNSGKAMAGTPVTFTAAARGGIEPFTYQFFVDGEAVGELSTSDECVYKFEKAGTYTVSVIVYNTFDEYETAVMTYTVVEPYVSEKPAIKSMYFNRTISEDFGTIVLGDKEPNYFVTANAFMGTAPYEYKFVLDDGVLTQDFSVNNIFKMRDLLTIGEHRITVQVRDADSQTTEEVLAFTVIDQPIG